MSNDSRALWKIAADLLAEAKDTIQPPSTIEGQLTNAEYMKMGSPFRMRIHRLRNGGTKIVILEHDWLKERQGRE